MPVYGLGKASKLVPATGKLKTSRERLRGEAAPLAASLEPGDD